MPPTRKELALAVLVFLSIPFFCELGLRMAHIHFDPQLYGPDRSLGWVLRPGATGLVQTETPQWVTINSQGFRDRERTFTKSANTFRIAVLGNSWTEAMQVPIEQTFPSVLERELNQQGCLAGQQVEVLNFGAAGYSTAQELLMLQERVWKYEPDVVLLAFYPARDIANNVRELNNAISPERSPYFVLKDGKLVEDVSFQALPALQPREIVLQNLAYRLNERVQLLQAVHSLQRMAKIRFAMAAAKERAQSSGMDNLEYAIYRPPNTPEMQSAWSVAEALLRAMTNEIKEHNAKFRLVVLATRPQVIPDPVKRREIEQKLGVADLTYADQRLKEFASEQRIAITLLAPELSAYAEAHHTYLNGFNKSNLGAGHWNATGHRLAAEIIAKDLCGSERAGMEQIPSIESQGKP